MSFVAAVASRIVQENVLAVGAALGCLVASAMMVWQAVDAERSAAARDRFGTAMADELAQLAAEPMLRQDRIGLGLLANRMTARGHLHRRRSPVRGRRRCVNASGPEACSPHRDSGHRGGPRPGDAEHPRVRAAGVASARAVVAVLAAGLVLVIGGCLYGGRVYSGVVAFRDRLRGQGTATLPARTRRICWSPICFKAPA